jgi:cob(I)alamin adenosyltransferase
MKIYTKTGDAGMTGLFGGQRISKDDIRIESYGTIDELNSFIGQLNASFTVREYNQILYQVQNRLFDIGSHLASDPEKEPLPSGIEEEDLVILEGAMDAMNETLPPLRHFILPGGDQVVALAHVCRTVCRRAERRVVALNRLAATDQAVVRYLNRLSDFFFVLARYLGQISGTEELKWIPKSPKG